MLRALAFAELIKLDVSYLQCHQIIIPVEFCNINNCSISTSLFVELYLRKTTNESRETLTPISNNI